MKISEMMTRDVQMSTPDQSIRDAARCMADLGCGALPVADLGRHLRKPEPASRVPFRTLESRMGSDPCGSIFLLP